MNKDVKLVVTRKQYDNIVKLLYDENGKLKCGIKKVETWGTGEHTDIIIEDKNAYNILVNSLTNKGK